MITSLREVATPIVALYLVPLLSIFFLSTITTPILARLGKKQKGLRSLLPQLFAALVAASTGIFLGLGLPR